jgi:hypothetical protein
MPRQLGAKVEEVDKDNSQLVDRNQANQGLTAEDIEDLKRQGKVRGAKGGVGRRRAPA